jgi:hypothetical protein
MLLVAAPEDGGGGGAEVAPADGRLYDCQVFPPGEDQGEFPGILKAKRRRFIMSSLISFYCICL